MSELQRRAYLDALGLDVWLARSDDSECAKLSLANGEGSVLLITGHAAACDSALAGDIVRCLGGDAVWAWPAEQVTAGGESLEEAVRQHLFTRLVVFGEKLAGELFAAGPPAVLLSSAVTISVELDKLAVDGKAKRVLWAALRGHA